MNKDPILTSKYSDTPHPIPKAMDQKINVASLTSLTAVLKRIMERAPTKPQDNALLLLIKLIIIVIMSVIIPKETLNLRLYAEPE